MFPVWGLHGYIVAGAIGPAIGGRAVLGNVAAVVSRVCWLEHEPDLVLVLYKCSNLINSFVGSLSLVGPLGVHNILIKADSTLNSDQVA